MALMAYGAYRVERRCPLHFCATHASRCREATAYRDIIHVDVFRVLEHDMVETLAWLQDETRGRVPCLHDLMTVED